MYSQIVLRSTPEKFYTFDDYWNLSNEEERYELIDGNIYISPYTYMYEIHELFYYFDNLIRGNSQHLRFGGRFWMSELNAILEPDLTITLNDSPRVIIDSSPEVDRFKDYFEGAPLLAIEITSQETYRTDMVVKFSLYEQAGIQEYWIVNPRTFSVTIWVLVEGQYQLHGEFVEEEFITSTILEGVAIRSRDLFQYYSTRETIAEQ